MQTITILRFGKIKDKNLDILILDLIKRIKRINIKILKEIKSEDIKIIKKYEENLIRKNINLSDEIFVLDENSKQYDTKDFSKMLISKTIPITFIISGPNGPSEFLRNNFKCLSLSKMTFTHNQAFYLLIEQIYRAQCIQNNISYTK